VIEISKEELEKFQECLSCISHNTGIRLKDLQILIMHQETDEYQFLLGFPIKRGENITTLAEIALSLSYQLSQRIVAGSVKTKTRTKRNILIPAKSRFIRSSGKFT